MKQVNIEALKKDIANKAATIAEARRIIDKAKEEAARKLADPNCSDRLNKAINSSLEAVKTAEWFIEKVAHDEDKTADRIIALKAVKISHHTSEKIEDADSVDSCSSCDFCEKASHCAGWICQKCYARRMNKRYINSLIRHAANVAILMVRDFTSAELAAMSASALYVRINSDGETPNATSARNILKWAGRPENKARNIGYWYKNTPAIREALETVKKPSNVILVQSSPITGKTAEWDGISDVIFTVFETLEEVNAAIAAGARRCNGVKCKDCGWKCYQKQHKTTGRPVYVAELKRNH